MDNRRVVRTVRIDPVTLELGQKLAKQMYGSEKRLGYVMDDAIRLLHAHQTDPKQAEAYLSNVENQVVRSLEKRLEAIGKRAIEVIDSHLDYANKRNGNLLARMTRESIYSSLALEEICVRAIPNFKKEIEPKIEKEAAQRMKRKLEYEGDQEGATYFEENERLKREVEELRGKLEQAKEYFRKQQQEREKWEADRRRLDERFEEVNRLKQERNHLAAWTRGLMTYLKENYSRVKSNEKLIEEYIQKNPKPEGV